MHGREQTILKVLHGFTDSVIKTRREELSAKKLGENLNDSGIKRKLALLDLLLQATIDGQPLNDMDIREEVDTFMFEGHDTTTSGISFCLYNIAKHPKVQQKIYEEIQTQIRSSDEALTLNDLNNLRYLELVIKESLRLYPSVPYFARRLSEEISVNGYTLPKGCSICIAPYLMGRDAKTFPDPLKFKPERFDVETTTEKVNPFAYVPFSAGKFHEGFFS
jgi:cytochrome P450 family 4